MPKKQAKKQSQESQALVQENAQPVEQVVAQPVEQVVAQPVEQVVAQDTKPQLVFQVSSEQQNQRRRNARKAGRTLLVRGTQSFDKLVGLQNRSDTKTTNSSFLTFDTVENALAAYKQLRTDSNVRVKFSYYRVFFTVDGLTDTSDYTQVKSGLVQWVESNASTQVLYCKLYRKDSKYLGCGDFTVDTLNGLNRLLSKDGGLKQFSFGNLSGTFYRYNNKTQPVVSSTQ
jgi:hypothetical protein